MPRGSRALVRLLLIFVAVGIAYLYRARQEPPPQPTSPTASSRTQQPRSSPEPETQEHAAGRRDLTADESRGGHTLARHVGRSDEQLRERLQRERGISAASTYTDRDTAERIVTHTI